MPKVKVTKKQTDPACAVRVSIGGEERIGYYCVYRGKPGEVIEAIERALFRLKAMGEEPEISPDDGKRYA